MSEQGGTVRFEILKADDEQRFVSGIAQFSAKPDGTLITDLQGDVIEPDELEKAFIDYALESRAGDVMHNKQTVAKLAELFVVTPGKLQALFKALGYGKDISDFKGSAAWVTYTGT